MTFRFQSVATVFLVWAFLTSCKSRTQNAALESGTQVQSRFVNGYVSPQIAFDAGAGVYKSQTPTTSAILKRDAARVFCSTLAPSLYGNEAAYIFDHYLGNTGQDIDVDFQSAIEESTVMKLIYTKELRTALAFAALQPQGKTQFSSVTPFGSKITRSDSLNWYLALGGFQVWSQSTLEAIPVSGGLSYVLTFDFFLKDRYNWDSGHTFNLGSLSVTSDELGSFHRMGISQEFTTSGVHRRVYKWNQTDDIALLPLRVWPRLKLTEKDFKIIKEQNIDTALF